MAHKHSVYDTDAHFSINPFTRAIKNESTSKVAVIQHDHNSERFTFEIPRLVDGHDMSLCDRVEVHYINMDSANKDNISADIYEVNDLQVSPDDRNFVICSWLLSQNATKYAGSLNFLVRFICLDGEKIAYAWHTAIFTGISVSSGILNNAEEIIEPYVDVLAQWKADLFSASEEGVVNITTAERNALAAIEAAGEAKKQAVLDSIPDEYEALSALADSNYRNKAGAIVQDVEGESIAVNDASEYPLQGLKLFGRSTQNGTPTPDAPVDIVSVENPAVVVCGKNLFNVNAIVTRSSVVNNGDGTITAKALVSQPMQTLKEICPSLKVGDIATFSFVSPAFDATSNTQSNYIYLISAKETWKNGQAKTITQKMLDGGIYFYSSKDADGNAVETVISEIQVELGEIATGYEPYIEAQTVETSHILPGIPVSSGGNYTDANGQQWICDEVDLARGVYVQRVKRLVLDGSETWRKSDSYLYIELEEHAIKGDKGFCSHFVFWYNYGGDCIFASEKWVYLGSTASANYDVDTWKEFLSGNNVTLLYILATPIETPLSDAEITAFKALHSNRPNTTILNDAGAFMAVEYVADTKTYIDNKIKELMEGVTE